MENIPAGANSTPTSPPPTPTPTPDVSWWDERNMKVRNENWVVLLIFLTLAGLGFYYWWTKRNDHKGLSGMSFGLSDRFRTRSRFTGAQYETTTRGCVGDGITNARLVGDLNKPV